MYTIKELYKIGNGPSSSHTMGPMNIVKEFLKAYPNCSKICVTLYGSLAQTGKGHLTDYIIKKTFAPFECDVVFDTTTLQAHPNTMEIRAQSQDGSPIYMKALSVGGGAISIEGAEAVNNQRIYQLTTFNQICEYCQEHDIRLYEYVDSIEQDDFTDYMHTIFITMLECIERGLTSEGVLPGELKIKRKAKRLFVTPNDMLDASEIARQKAISYAYAVAEENACGGEVVTSPTCGASGVVPACLKYAMDKGIYSNEQLINALKTAGLIGNLVKHNASISGAEAGCQAEIGTACSMAAAFLAELDNSPLESIERAAEIALEHHLGLTCDPIYGYVQIPCIERNAVATLRAIDANTLSKRLIEGDSRISFDLVVETMLATGRDLSSRYRETSQGGLAKKYK